MKQKIVVKVALNDQKSRSKALKIAIGISGVESVILGGNDKSRIEIVGDGVDANELTTILRKKVGSAEIVSISTAVGEKKEEKKEEAKEAQQLVGAVGLYDSGGSPTTTVQNRYHFMSNACSIM